jgi:hypothetical protein
MLITTEIVKIVTQYYVRIFSNYGYKIGDLAIVKIEDWNKNSHEYIPCMITSFQIHIYHI